MTKTTPQKRRMMTASSEPMPDRDHMAKVAETLKVSCPQMDPSSLSDTISSPQIERINERELHSIYALLAYVAYNQNVRQETVQMIVEAKFGVDHVAKIRRNDYMNAIEFLVDVKVGEVMN